jgi:hypothetical protein
VRGFCDRDHHGPIGSRAEVGEVLHGGRRRDNGRVASARTPAKCGAKVGHVCMWGNE